MSRLLIIVTFNYYLMFFFLSLLQEHIIISNLLRRVIRIPKAKERGERVRETLNYVRTLDGKCFQVADALDEGFLLLLGRDALNDIVDDPADHVLLGELLAGVLRRDLVF